MASTKSRRRQASATEPSKAEIATEAWRPIVAFVVATASRRSRVLDELGLTPTDGRSLASLEAETGRSMRSLADDWGCDASTVTWAVDRLEARGLAERRSAPHDRRLNLVALTPAGVLARDEIRARAEEPPSELLQLRRSELVALRDAAARLPTPSTSPGDSTHGRPPASDQ